MVLGPPPDLGDQKASSPGPPARRPRGPEPPLRLAGGGEPPLRHRVARPPAVHERCGVGAVVPRTEHEVGFPPQQGRAAGLPRSGPLLPQRCRAVRRRAGVRPGGDGGVQLCQAQLAGPRPGTAARLRVSEPFCVWARVRLVAGVSAVFCACLQVRQRGAKQPSFASSPRPTPSSFSLFNWHTCTALHMHRMMA